MTDEQTAQVHAIRDHAHRLADYQTNNWDILVECFEDEDVVRAIDNATSFEEATVNVLSALDLIAEVQFGRFPKDTEDNIK